MSHSSAYYRLHHVVIAATCMLVSCGGGGGSPAPFSSTAAPSRAVEQSDSKIAQSVYGDGARTPSGFYSDAPPSGREYVATVHLKNTDIDAAAVAPQPLYELCTNDWNQALTWSESSAQTAPQYADLVETNDDARYFEFGRVRQGEPQFYTRARVFKCAYVDRSDANLRVSAGPAGQLNQRPLTTIELRNLSEYLWQFTTYNNVGHAVLKSSGTTNGDALTHTLHMGSLVRSGLSSACDRIDVSAWQHSVNASSGEMQLDLQTLWSFGARETGGVVELCSG